MNLKDVQLEARRESSYGSMKDDRVSPDIRDDDVGWKFWKKRRLVIGVLAFLGFAISYTFRAILSVAIVAMTSESSEHKAEFDWDSEVQGLVLSSFFYGYITTQVLGGWLAARIGGKKILGLSIASTALLTIITPPLTRISVYVLVALRIVEGICEGVTFPSMHGIWANWAPPLERSKLAIVAYSGCYAGTVISMLVSGILIENFGWPSVFYVFGVLGLMWFAVWWAIVTDEPEDDPKISRSELEYIKRSLSHNSEKKKILHPWKEILKSPPVWAIVAAHFSENWGAYTLLTQLPTFMSDVLNFKLEEAGYLSALPYLVTAIVLQLSGCLADYIRSINIFSLTQVRKIFTCGAFVCQAIFMISSPFVGSATGAVVFLIIAVGLGGFACTGFGVNHLDIAPEHASIIMGIENTIATIPGILSPIISGYIVKNKSPGEWRIVFIIAGTIYFIGAIIYGLFASGEKQKWVEDSKKKNLPLEVNRRMELDEYVK